MDLKTESQLRQELAQVWQMLDAERAGTAAAVAAERERCIAVLRALEDRSGVNDDGQAWLMRLTRGDCVRALLDLGPNVRAKPATAAAAPDVENEQLLSAAVGART